VRSVQSVIYTAGVNDVPERRLTAGPHRRCRTARSDPGERWPSRLVAAAAENRLSFPSKPAVFQIEKDGDRDERDHDCEHEQNSLHVIAHLTPPIADEKSRYCEYRSQWAFPSSSPTLASWTNSSSEHPRAHLSHCCFLPKSRAHASAPASTI
jgi:hypothetical protein